MSLVAEATKPCATPGTKPACLIVPSKIDRKTFRCPISAAKLLSAARGRRIIQLELDITGAGIKYKPGDCISVFPQNPPDLVDVLLQRLRADDTMADSVPYPVNGFTTPFLPKDQQTITLQDALLYVYDFRRWLSEPVFALLKQHTTNPQEREQIMMIMETMTNPPAPQTVFEELASTDSMEEVVQEEEALGSEGTLACPCKGSCKNYPRNLAPPSPKIFSREASMDGRSPKMASLVNSRTRTSSTTASGAEAEDMIMAGQVSLLEFLTIFPSCSPPLVDLLRLLPLLTPRPYSISCSPLVFPNSIHVVFTASETHLHYAGHNFARKGVATSHMERLCQAVGANTPDSPPSLIFSVRHSSGFTLPEDLSQSILMIGAGTGIAPFRSFLQHLTYLRKQAAGDDLSTIPPRAFGCEECPQNLTSSGRLRDIEDAPEGLRHFGQSWLFFGCRHPQVDCLFRDELETMQEVGALTKLELAFSRMLQEEEEVTQLLEDEDLLTPRGRTKHYHKYVQHILRSQPKDLYEMIASRRATLFVCGSMDGMVKDTHQQLVALVRGERHCSQQEAENFLRELEKGGQYIREAWI